MTVLYRILMGSSPSSISCVMFFVVHLDIDVLLVDLLLRRTIYFSDPRQSSGDETLIPRDFVSVPFHLS